MSCVRLGRNLTPGEDDLAQLRDRFHDFVQARFPGLPDESQDQHFLFTLSSGDELVGGICGSVYWDGLEIDTLWVDDRFRGRGFGRELVTEAESHAREQGAVIAFLKTVDATEFYRILGYEIFGILEDRPIGSRLYHMKKRLDRPAALKEESS